MSNQSSTGGARSSGTRMKIIKLNVNVDNARHAVYSKDLVKDLLSKVPQIGVPIFAANTLSSNLKQIIEDWNLEMNTTGIVFCAISMNCLKFSGSRAPQNFADGTSLHYGDYEADMSALKSTNVLHATKGEIKTDISDETIINFCKSVYESIDGAFRWLVDLIACYQTRPMNGTNIESYFMAISGTRVRGKIIVPLIEFAAASFPKVTDNSDLRTGLSKAKFMRYHTAKCSTPGLVSRFLNSVPTLRAKLADATVEALIADAVADYWDLDKAELIPKRLLVAAFIYFEVSKIEVGDWYQGKRAMSETSGTTITQVRAFMKKYNEMVLEDADVDKISNLGEAASHIPQGIL
ncbi:hypothetical protein [Beihai sesarmid crab virus 3]|uniref:Uncharacterized protein n=1 Tax=Beihai sesarmid crab virus 3 TaxID=1922663 RepID=A0A1L3KL50_9VIRU|nr:hypothetical protein [Beihai sesarmid crab virus 3]APG78140.1 hypothetical protein [Beihai sesarmid crab virus 3]